jgi:hypothetical protein
MENRAKILFITALVFFSKCSGGNIAAVLGVSVSQFEDGWKRFVQNKCF